VVGPRTASCEGPSRQCRTRQASMQPPARAPLNGERRAGSSGWLPPTGNAVLGVPKAPCGSSLPSPAGLSFSVSRCHLLGHLQLAANPPPLAPARLGQGRFAWLPATTGDDGRVGPPPRSRGVRSVGPRGPCRDGRRSEAGTRGAAGASSEPTRGVQTLNPVHKTGGGT
jgi:hypothetical protein